MNSKLDDLANINPDSLTRCKCENCNRHRIIRKAIKDRDTNKLIELLNAAEDAYLDASQDADYYKSIFEGEWPNAVEILEKHLAIAKEKADDEGEFNGPDYDIDTERDATPKQGMEPIC